MKIYGNTVGTTLPRPNFDQTDPGKGDYILGDRSFTRGEDGTTFTPSVSAAGDLSWTNNGGLANPETVNLMGADGHTPVKGTDYYTDTDKEEMVEAVLEAVPQTQAITVDREAGKTTLTVAMDDGTASVLVIGYGSNGEPETLTVDGRAVSLEFITHELLLYLSGDQCTTLTGGWKANGNTKGSVTENRTPTLDMTAAMVISLATDKNSAQGSVMTVNPVDLTNYSKLCFQVTAISGKVDLGYTAAPGSSYTLADSVRAAEGLNTLDISGVTGTYTIAMAVTAYMDEDTGITVEKVFLE